MFDHDRRAEEYMRLMTEKRYDEARAYLIQNPDIRLERVIEAYPFREMLEEMLLLKEEHGTDSRLFFLGTPRGKLAVHDTMIDIYNRFMNQPLDQQPERRKR